MAKFCVGLAECFFFFTVLVWNSKYVNYVQCYKTIIYITIDLHKNIHIYQLHTISYCMRIQSLQLPEDGHIQWPKHVAAVKNKHGESSDVCPNSVR
jgi:hypothetical protein